MPTVGVLALQGGVREHARALESAGAAWKPVRRPADLTDIDAIILPGGESTTIGRLAGLYGLVDPLREVIKAGLPTFGTCAGMIFLAAGTTGADQNQLGVLDIIVERNAFGRQNESFETDLEIEGLGEPFPAVFIRAPWVAKIGAGVEVTASIDGHPVMVRQGNVIATAFHPELTDDIRIHTMVLELGRGGLRVDGEQ